VHGSLVDHQRPDGRDVVGVRGVAAKGPAAAAVGFDLQSQFGLVKFYEGQLDPPA